MKSTQIKYLLISITLIVGVLTCLHPLYPTEQFLQHIGTVALLFIPVLDLKKNELPLGVFTCIIVFTLLHIVGARYLYSYVPYNEWIKSILHIDINTILQTNRNHYDRLVHFSFGALFFPYLYELFDKKQGLNVVMKIIIVWALIQTASMLYELFEWTLTLVLSNQAANDYNGQQGDMWDAQKDMALAMFGSSILALVYWIKNTKKPFNHSTN